MIGAASGGLVLIAGLMTYVFSTIPSILRTQLNLDVNVVSLNYNSSLDRLRGVFNNAGADPVFLKDVQFFFPSKSESVVSRSRALDFEVGSGLLEKEDGRKIDGTIKGFSMAYVVGVDRRYKLNSDWIRKIYDRTDCFSISVSETVSLGGSLSAGVIEEGDRKFLEVPHETYLRYFSAKSGNWIVKKIDTRAFLGTNGENEECAEVMRELAFGIPADEVVFP
jgi:hypothetical protein